MSNKLKPVLQYKNILELCDQHGFLKRVAGYLELGPIGNLLLENLKNEFWRSAVTNREYSVFMNSSNFEDAYLYTKDMCSGRLPFGIAEIVSSDSREQEGNLSDFSTHFEKNDLFRCTVYVQPNASTQFFHQLQRQRRMWWRIFSANPGRYSFADLQSTDDNSQQTVEIQAEYPWGMQLLEKITLCKNLHKDLSKDQMECKSGRNTVVSHYVTNEVSIPTMLLNTICDAFDEPSFQGQLRPMFRFHRKLSPYKISFSLSKKSQSTVNEDLLQLGVYLCKQLRENNISCLLLPLAIRNTLEAQWALYDQMGIPYNILLNENTLKNGVAQLRSRDTTLKEQVHVSELPKYVDQLFKNY